MKILKCDTYSLFALYHQGNLCLTMEQMNLKMKLLNIIKNILFIKKETSIFSKYKTMKLSSRITFINIPSEIKNCIFTRMTYIYINCIP